MKISLNVAAELLLQGRVVAVPTETVYGLAASLYHSDAVEQIFTLKGRPANNPLIVHLAEQTQIQQFVKELPPHFDKLAQCLWPGPLTLVIPVDIQQIPEKARAGLPTAAFRVPQHPLARQLLHQTGPLVMPSANISGKPSATQRAHIETDFGCDFPVLDGGVCQRGLESTILHYSQDRWQMIRLGALAPENFAPILGYEPRFCLSTDAKMPLCPGQMYRHYAPNSKLILSTSFPEGIEGVLLGFNDRSYPSSFRLWSLGSSSDPEQVAGSLYEMLRRLDHEGIAMAWVDMNFSKEGLWNTIAERLQKASTSQY